MKTFLRVASLAAVLMWGAPSFASQGSGCMPTSGVVSGLTLVQDINAGIAALISSNSGATAPTTDCTAVSIKGQLWLDTSTTPNHLRIYDAANWLDLGAVDSVSHVWTPPIGGGSSTLASATTTDLCSSSNRYFSITGTTTISSFSNTCVVGEIKSMTFAGILTLTYNATSMILPTAADITTQAGDSLLALYLGGGNWRVMAYTRADGTALNTNSVIAGAISFTGVLTPTALSGNTNNWNPTSLAVSSIIRMSASSAVNLTGITAPAVSQDGRMLILQNVGTFNITLTSNDAGSTAANRFGFPSPIVVRPGSALTVFYDHTSNLWRLGNPHTSQPVAGGFKALVVKNDTTNGTTLNNNMLITADQITVEDVNGSAVRLSSVNCSADVTASGAGGLDTGTVATSTQYYEWVIFNPTTNTTSCMFSLRSVAFGGSSISLPSGYTFAARVGGNFTDGSSHWKRIYQAAREAFYVVVAGGSTTALPIVSSGSTSGVLTAVSVSSAVPATASSVRVVLFGPNTSGACYAAPNTDSGSITSTTNPPQIGTSVSSSIVQIFQALFSLNGGTTVAYYGNVSGCGIAVAGWVDNL